MRNKDKNFNMLIKLFVLRYIKSCSTGGIFNAFIVDFWQGQPPRIAGNKNYRNIATMIQATNVPAKTMVGMNI